MKHRDPTGTTGTQDAWARYGWLMGAIWLVFLVYPSRALLESEASLGLRVLGWVSLALFAAAYLAGFVYGMRSPASETSPISRVLFGVALGCVLLTAPAIGWHALSFMPFLMSYSSYLLSRSWHWAANTIGPAIVIAYTVLQGVSGRPQPWGLMWIVLMIALVNSINSSLIRRSERADALRIELATSEERESGARDVHDLLGHSLTVVKLKAELASRLIDQDPAAARSELDEIVRLASEAIAGVRGTVTGMRAEGLNEQLAASKTALQSAGIALEVRGAASALSPAQSIPAAWILREATTNVLRHSGARRVTVELAAGTLVIHDDGTGMPHSPADALPAAGGAEHGAAAGIGDSPAGNGLRGMAERAAAAGAELVVASGANTGTKVRLTW